MNNKIFAFLLALSLIACGDPKEKMIKEMLAIQQSEEIGTKAGLDKLAALHQEYGLKYQDSTANYYLYAAAMYYYQSDTLNRGKELFREYFKRATDMETQKNARFAMAKIYSEESEHDSMALMMTQALDLAAPTPTQWNQMAEMYQRKLEAEKAIPEDLERLSLAHTAIGAYDAALDDLDMAILEFPDYEGRAKLIYRAGFVAWEYAKDNERATTYYSDFLEQYPKHELAQEVSVILNSGMLEKSDEEILDMLKAKS